MEIQFFRLKQNFVQYFKIGLLICEYLLFSINSYVYKCVCEMFHKRKYKKFDQFYHSKIVLLC